MFAFKEEDLALTAPWPAGRRVTQRETLRAQEKLSSVASIQKTSFPASLLPRSPGAW